jgi:hypothetical protein
MARQASEIRPAIPYVHLEAFEDALDAIDLEVSVDGEVVDTEGLENVKLPRDRFLDARYRLAIAPDILSRAVERGVLSAGLSEGAVSLICFATSVTLKQTELVYPGRVDGKVQLTTVSDTASVPHEIALDPSTNPRLFHDVSSGFRVSYGLVLGRDIDTTDPLTPKWKGTWLAHRARRLEVVRERTGSYEIHELTPERRQAFGLEGRPLFYLHQADDAISPLLARYLDEVLEIYVDADVLPLLRSERPGAATRFVASQIARDVHVMVLELGALDDDVESADAGSVFAVALSRLRGRAKSPDLAEIRSWIERDPGHLSAWVQAKMQQIDAAEALLAS